MPTDQILQEDAIAAAIVASLVITVGWLAFFYTRDRYDPEPKKLIAQLLGVGAVVAIAAGIVNGIINAVVHVVVVGEAGSVPAEGGGPEVLAVVIFLVLVAPFSEEILKYLGTRLRTVRSEHFDEPIDGMIYGSTVGLGFALVENVGYFVPAAYGLNPMGAPACAGVTGWECMVRVIVLRGLGTTVMHAVAAGIAGYFLAKHVLGGQSSQVEVKGVAAAVGLHMLWNATPLVTQDAFVFFIGGGLLILLYLHVAAQALAASPHRVSELDDERHVVEHLAHRDGVLQVCPGCERPQPLTQRFCTVCGLRLRETSEPHMAPCGNCARPQPMTARFCVWCGTPSTVGAPEPPATPEPPAPDPGAPPEPEPEPNWASLLLRGQLPARLPCPTCGTLQGTANRFCVGCGAAITSTDDEPPSLTETSRP